MDKTEPPPVFACPACAEPLTRSGPACSCRNGHFYDVAREAYVNLLLAQHRHSKDPGYSKEMITGRRDFFDAGHYQPLADDVARLVLDHLPDRRGSVVLDAGCGEGYYLRRLRSLASDDALGRDARLHGIDISKHGIRIAAKRDPAGQYAVAAIHRMPVLAGSVDLLLTHFSPVSVEDFRRVVRPGGVVVVSGPGPRHLYSFKELLYDRPAEHEQVDPLAGDPGLALVGTRRIRHPLTLRGSREVTLLLRMTPFYWSADAAAQSRLAQVAALDTEIDVVARVYRRLPQPSGADVAVPR